MAHQTNPEFNGPGRADQELLRLTFCGIVIASFFAALTASPDLKTLLNPAGISIATTVLALSAGFAFGYVLSVASALKYQGPRYIDRFPVNRKVSEFLYDTSINIFGVYVLVLLIEWADAHFLHLPHVWWIWPVYIFLFGVMYGIARALWRLAQILIEWQYEAQNKV